MIRYFHVSETYFDIGDVLTPAASRPEDTLVWDSLYRGDEAWRTEFVWLFASAADAYSYDPCTAYFYEVEVLSPATVQRHLVSDCICGDEANDCPSLDCDMPAQYIATAATVTVRLTKGV